MSVIQVLDSSAAVAKFCLLKPSCHAARFSLCPFTVDHETDAFFCRQLGKFFLVELLGERLSEAEQLHLVEFGNRLLVQHEFSFQW